MTSRVYDITLRIVLDEPRYASPSQWDWCELLDDPNVTVVQEVRVIDDTADDSAARLNLDNYYTLLELCEIAKFTPEGYRSWRRFNGNVPQEVKVGRRLYFYKPDVHEWVAKHRMKIVEGDSK